MVNSIDLNISQIDWREPGTIDREPRNFSATGRPGRWLRIVSRYAFEQRWFAEELTPELCRRADEEWKRATSPSLAVAVQVRY